MAERRQLPRPVCAVIGEVIGSHYYNHNRLNTLFMECGAPGEPPEGNCVTKCTQWLKRCNDDPNTDPFTVMGCVIEEFMEVDSELNDEWQKGKERIIGILGRYGLSYHKGGHVTGGTAGAPTRALMDILADRDFAAVEAEFERAVKSVEADPPAGVTAACSIIESLCKVYIEEHNLSLPGKQTIKDLWKVVAKDLGFDLAAVADDDIKRILSGLTSVVDGTGSLRTHAGSAHGRGKKLYKLKPRHARLAIHAAHTLATFILETWDEQS